MVILAVLYHKRLFIYLDIVLMSCHSYTIYNNPYLIEPGRGYLAKDRHQ
jgi:hypothetical protein